MNAHAQYGSVVFILSVAQVVERLPLKHSGLFFDLEKRKLSAGIVAFSDQHYNSVTQIQWRI